MGARTGTALRGLKFFLRAIQFCCAALVLAIFSYFLATLQNHGLSTATWIRAVEGISGSAVLYTALCAVALCCTTGVVPVLSLAGMFLDFCFAGAFIYVASANRGGAGSCSGTVDTPFGTGDADTGKVDDGQPGFTALPSLKQACQMETACMAVSILAIFFFIFSILAELALIRHHRKERRFGPSPANGYTEGYAPKRKGLAGLFGFFGSRKKRAGGEPGAVDPNALPEHVHPDDLRSSYATEQTRVGTGNGAGPKYDTLAYGGHDIGDASHETGTGTGTVTGFGGVRYDDVPLSHYPPGNYRYDDGVYNRV